MLWFILRTVVAEHVYYFTKVACAFAFLCDKIIAIQLIELIGILYLLRLSHLVEVILILTNLHFQVSCSCILHAQSLLLFLFSCSVRADWNKFFMLNLNVKAFKFCYFFFLFFCWRRRICSLWKFKNN